MLQTQPQYESCQTPGTVGLVDTVSYQRNKPFNWLHNNNQILKVWGLEHMESLVEVNHDDT